MDQVVIAARKRAETGKAAVGRLRKEGRLPGVMYDSKGQAVSVDLNALEFANGIKGITESTLLKMDIDGSSHEVFVKDTQRNILNGQILHVDFYEVERGKVLHARVPLHVSGSPVGIRVGGILEVPMHELEVACFPKDLPEKVEVDVSALDVNQSMHVRDLKLAAGVKILTSEDQVIALVKFQKGEETEESEEVEEEKVSEE